MITPAPSMPGFGPQADASIRVDRAQTELRHGRIVLVMPLADQGAEPPLLALALETLSEARWRQCQASGLDWRLVFTAERLQALGWPQASGPRTMRFAPGTPLAVLQTLAAVRPGEADTGLLSDPDAAPGAAEAALLLAKRARLAPTLLVADAPPDWPASPWLSVGQDDVRNLAGPGSAPELQRVSDAQVPLALADVCTLVLFREVDGSAEHVAILVGDPDLSGAVPVRLHSSCLTGDLLGSLRCDCGDQLQRAMEHLANTSGILLYLSQEGRGTGLASKLRAYRLQDAGLDTIDADRHLGFRGDERDFQVAVAMLNALGVSRVKLLTNNPRKIDALRQGGIDVVERLALVAPTNPHNERYIQTKRDRAGHLHHVDDEQGEQ